MTKLLNVSTASCVYFPQTPTSKHVGFISVVLEGDNYFRFTSVGDAYERIHDLQSIEAPHVLQELSKKKKKHSLMPPRIREFYMTKFDIGTLHQSRGHLILQQFFYVFPCEVLQSAILLHGTKVELDTGATTHIPSHCSNTACPYG